MLKGTVTFRATIRGNGLCFPLFDFNPMKAGIEKVQIEAPAPNGDEIHTTVHFNAVASEAEARALATEVRKLQGKILPPRHALARSIILGLNDVRLAMIVAE